LELTEREAAHAGQFLCVTAHLPGPNNRLWALFLNDVGYISFGLGARSLSVESQARRGGYADLAVAVAQGGVAAGGPDKSTNRFADAAGWKQNLGAVARRVGR
jgi:hypothetical protein